MDQKILILEETLDESDFELNEQQFADMALFRGGDIVDLSLKTRFAVCLSVFE